MTQKMFAFNLNILRGELAILLLGCLLSRVAAFGGPRPTRFPSPFPTTSKPTASPTLSPSLPCYITPEFDESSVMVNNLGGYCGAGANETNGKCGTGVPQEIRITRVATLGDQTIDMVITAKNTYEPSIKATWVEGTNTGGHYNNGLILGGDLQINVLNGATLELNIKFEQNGAPIALDGEIRFADVDMGLVSCTSFTNECTQCKPRKANKVGRELVSMPLDEIDSSTFGQDLCETEATISGYRSWWATSRYYEDGGLDNDVKEFQNKVKAQVVFKNKMEINPILRIKGGSAGNGRNFLIGFSTFSLSSRCGDISAPTKAPTSSPTETCTLAGKRLHLCISVDSSGSIDDSEWASFQQVVSSVLADSEISAAITDGDANTRGSVSSVIWESLTSNCGQNDDNCEVQLIRTIDGTLSDVIDSVSSKPPGISFTPLSIGSYECSRVLYEESLNRNYGSTGIEVEYVNLILTDGWCNVKCGNPCMNDGGCGAAAAFGDTLGVCNSAGSDCLPDPGSYCNTNYLSDSAPLYNTESCGTPVGCNSNGGCTGNNVCECSDDTCSTCTDIDFYNGNDPAGVHSELITPARVQTDWDSLIPLTVLPVFVLSTDMNIFPDSFLRQLGSNQEYIQSASFADLATVERIQEIIEAIRCANGS